MIRKQSPLSLFLFLFQKENSWELRKRINVNYYVLYFCSFEFFFFKDVRQFPKNGHMRFSVSQLFFYLYIFMFLFFLYKWKIPTFCLREKSFQYDFEFFFLNVIKMRDSCISFLFLSLLCENWGYRCLNSLKCLFHKVKMTLFSKRQQLCRSNKTVQKRTKNKRKTIYNLENH